MDGTLSKPSQITDVPRRHSVNQVTIFIEEGTILFHFIFISFEEGGPLANAGLQGALHLRYNILIKNKVNIYFHLKIYKYIKLPYNY